MDFGEKQSIYSINRFFIYLLWFDNEVVYVGQSKHGTSRILNHIDQKDKIFNSFSLILTAPQNLNDLEAEYIIRLKPKYNKTLPANSKYKSINVLCKEFGFSSCLVEPLKQMFKHQIIAFDSLKITPELIEKFKEICYNLLKSEKYKGRIKIKRGVN